MKTIWTLMKLQFKARVALPKNRGHKHNIKIAGIIAALLAVFAAFVYVYYMLALQFVDHSFINPDHIKMFDLSRPLLIFTLLIFTLLQTIFLIPSLVRSLDINNDRELLLKLPVSHRQIFASKVIVAYLFEIVFATFLLLPILLAFGLATGMHWGFYLYIPFIIVFIPVIPFFIASLLLYPATKLIQFFRSRTILTSIGYLILLVGGIVLYMYIIEMGMTAITDEANLREFLRQVDASGSMATTANAFFPQWLLSNMLGTQWYTALWSGAAVIGISAVLIVIAYFVAGSNYKRTYMDERTSFFAIRKKSEFKQSSALMATFKKDSKNIFRSSNYTFQFVLLVIVMPLLVYFVNRIAMFSSYQSFRAHKQAPEAGGMLFGVSLFVIMILLPLASSFAASNITREGNNIYHTKLIPQSFRKQLMIKIGIVLVPIILAIALSIALIMIPYNPDPVAEIAFNLPPSDAIYLFFVSALMAVGYICMGTYLDLRKPLCNQVGGGELTKSTSHINTIICVGILLGSVFGLLAMLGGFGLEVFGEGWLTTLADIGKNVWWVFLTIAGIFSVVSIGLLVFDGPRKYARLEQ